MKPRAFIGSSQEHLELAHAVQANLEHDVECQVWDQNVFKLSEYPLESLRQQLQKSDFGIFVLSPSDVSIIRNKKHDVPRDNVIFELGLFAGFLGHKRTFIITPSDSKNLHLPSDLKGLNAGSYDPNRSDKNLQAALGTVCSTIKRLITERSSAIKKENPGFIKAGFFTDFDKESERLLALSSQIWLYFIHSRRWRESNHEAILNFLKKPKSKLFVFLPDLKNKPLIESIMGHFDDGLHIPEFVADVYRYFSDLKKDFKHKVVIRLFNVYPTYTFYKFDDTFLVALYPTTANRKTVPAFLIDANSPYGEFFSLDLKQLFKECRIPKKQEIADLRRTAGLFRDSADPRN